MNKIILAVTAVALCLLATTADAQVTASSYSTGGTAISTASGRGNTRLNATSMATGGGYARADMRGSGRNGGFASGNSTAIAAGGVAISNGRSRTPTAGDRDPTPTRPHLAWEDTHEAAAPPKPMVLGPTPSQIRSRSQNKANTATLGPELSIVAGSRLNPPMSPKATKSIRQRN